MDTIVIFDPAPGPSAAATYSVLPLDSTTTFTATPSFTIDLSGYDTGDVLVIWYGYNDTPTGVTYNSNTMTQIANASSDANRRLSAWQYTLTGAGGASDTVDITIGGATGTHMFCAVVVSGKSVAASDNDAVSNVLSTDLTGAVTVSNSSNLAIGVAVAESSSNGIDWLTGITTEEEELNVNTGAHYMSVAKADNVATGTLNVTANLTSGVYDGNSDRNFSIVLFE